MKKFLFLLIAGFCTVQLSGQTINFSVQPLSGESELSAASQEMLQNKLRQIITRNSAGAANDYNVFVIEPVITVLDKQSTSGLMRNTTLVKGELTLVAKNRIDGSMYHSAVVSVSGQAAEGADPYKAMISALRTTDPVYTRFIRIARQKIQDYYAANCATILQKAQSLYNLKKYPEALSYLSAVSESVPCYEQASVLQTELAQYVPDVQPDTVIIQKVIEKPVEVEKIVERIVEKQADTAGSVEAMACDLLDNIYFEFDKDVLTAASEKTLDRLAGLLKSYPDARFLITGYTDARGSSAYNTDLSNRRAKRVYEALLERGVPAAMLKWHGIGKRASIIPVAAGNSVREGDRKVLLERITNMKYWEAL